MSAVGSASRRSALRLHPAWVVAALSLAAALLTAQIWSAELAPARWFDAIWHFDDTDLAEVMLRESLMPRLVVAILCGAALALAGTIFQQVLRNPLAEPATLGISGGAYLALAFATFYAPGLLVSREAVALIGGGSAILLAFIMAGRRGFSPIAVMLAALMVNMICGALAASLAQINDQGSLSLFVWASGSLTQRDWGVAREILLALALACIIIVPLLRPLDVASLSDETARALGVPLKSLRIAALALAVVITAIVTSRVGVIGFIGLAGPAIARYAGARTLAERLIWGALTGAALLWLTDAAAQRLSPAIGEIPTGAVTALLGAPLLLLLLTQSRGTAPSAEHGIATEFRAPRTPLVFVSFAVAFALASVLLLATGRGLHGWTFSNWSELQPLLVWRLPRMIGSFAGGSLVAIAGVIIQRLTANPISSPEVLGISAGSALAVIGVAVLGFDLDRPSQMMIAGLGAVVTFAGMLAFAHRSAFTPERLLFAGIALGTLLGAVLGLLLATDNPQIFPLLRWITGSTYLVRGEDALLVSVCAVVVLALALLCARWLAILPLGDTVSTAIGVELRRARFCLLLLSSAATGVATIVIGPLSFVGLMAPHMARMLGFARPAPEIAASAMIGGLLMMIADWLGRNLIFPRELPAGLIATVIGAAYFMWLMRREPG